MDKFLNKYKKIKVINFIRLFNLFFLDCIFFIFNCKYVEKVRIFYILNICVIRLCDCLL